MAVFLSYAHQDVARVEILHAELDALAGPVWLDRSLTGGQVWWDEILAQLRECRLFVLALSTNSLRSEACIAELGYSLDIQRPFVAVRVDDVDLVAAPEAVRRTQVVDFSTRDVDSVRALAKAVLGANPPGALPDILPDEPLMPRSYRDRFDGVFAGTLGLDRQISLFARLKFDIDQGNNLAEATDLLRHLYERADLSWKIRQDISAVLGEHETSTHAPPSTAGQSPSSAPFQSDDARQQLDPGQTRREAADQVRIAACRGHSGIVTSILFSPDSTILASTSHDGTIRLWDPRSGLEMRRLVGHEGSVRSLAWSPDGTILATAGLTERVRLWDPATGTEQRQLPDTEWVYAVAFSPDGTILACTGSYAGVRLYDPATGLVHRHFEGHNGQLTALAFSPGGTILATAGDDGVVRLWDPATGTEQRTFEVYSNEAESIAFSPDGSVLAIAITDCGSVSLFDPATDDDERQLNTDSDLQSIAFSPDGTMLATGGYSVLLWDLATGIKQSEFTDETGPVAFSPDGTMLANVIDSSDAEFQSLPLPEFSIVVRRMA